ncbi:MAG: endonuclease/exonuclease/phosphatase family protein, partial [Bacteroidales bacterium]|nr:endonuclease/exonuclease/phosphatase family protein [Bacteroidales bacterium]
GNPKGKIVQDSIISILSWNIGYAGMGAETDFFYDGGKMVRPSRELNRQYFESILAYLRSQETLDFILLQEVDKKAKRSYYTDQTADIRGILTKHTSVFAKNYDVLFVPVPMHNPMGTVAGGMLSFSGYQPHESKRISFPGNYDWPTRLFMLKRCFIQQRFPCKNGKNLVVINTHNSAFDDGTLRLRQLEKIKETVLNEYQHGNFVIVGGDWNMNPPGFDPGQIVNGDFSVVNPLGSIPEDFMPLGWQWIYDPTKPTNREVVTTYFQGQTPTSVIDFFLLSPNVKSLSIETDDQSFRFSDHNPLKIKILLDFEL